MIEYLLRFVSVFINNLFVAYLTHKAINKDLKLSVKNITIIALCTFLVCLNQAYAIPELRLLSNYFIEIFMLAIISKDNFKEKVFYFSMIMIFGIIIEMLVTIALTIFFKNIFEVSFFFQLAITLFCYFIWFGGWYLLNLNPRIRALFIKLEKTTSKLFTIEFLIMILLVAVDIILVQKYLNFQESFLIFAAIVSINILFLLIFIILKIKFKEESLKISNSFLQENIKLYEKVIEDHKTMKHNLFSDFVTIKSISNTKTQKVIDEIIKKYQGNYEWINSINKIPEGLRGLFCLKILEANKQKVKVISESSGINLKNITDIMSPKKYINLCEKLDILLTNAIEAAAVSQDKYIKINIEKAAKNKIKIVILNTFSNDLDVSRIGQREYSTKNRNSGFGIYSLFKNKTEHIKTSFKIINNIYITTLIINLGNKKSYKK